MSGPDLKQLSSNWKKLQEKLKSDKKKEPPANNGLKRKRVESTKSTSSGINKKTKISKDKDSKLRKMGYYLSSPSTSRNDLIKDHDIDPSAITAAYGPSSKTTAHTDTINSGQHPTNKLGKYIALDCEMVGTGPPPHTDNVLARVSLVNFHGDQIYDSYVLPPPNVPIKDYRTHVSGIKPQHLRTGYARPFAEVQQDVSNILDGRILVGHALRNDLNVLMLSHPKRDLRDTSRYAKYRIESGGRPPALRKLAKSELGLEIQTGEHSSLIDARTTMALYRKEKRGFEEDNRKRFGNRRVEKEKGDKGKEVSPSVEDESEEEDEDDEDDMELLDGEEDEEFAEETVTANTTGPKAKKKKKKKRTKRK